MHDVTVPLPTDPSRDQLAYQDACSTLCGYPLLVEATRLALEGIRAGRLTLDDAIRLATLHTRRHDFVPYLLYRRLLEGGSPHAQSDRFLLARKAAHLLEQLRQGRDPDARLRRDDVFQFLHCALVDHLERGEEAPDYLVAAYIHAGRQFEDRGEGLNNLYHWLVHASILACHPGDHECDFEPLALEATRFMEFFNEDPPPEAMLRHACANLSLRVKGIDGDDPLYDQIHEWHAGQREAPWDLMDQHPLAELVRLVNVIHPERAQDVCARRREAVLAHADQLGKLAVKSPAKANEKLREACRKSGYVDAGGVPLFQSTPHLEQGLRLEGGDEYPNRERWRRLGRRNTLECVRFLGGTTIGKTSVLVRYSSGSVLLDFGLSKPNDIRWLQFEELPSIEALLLSHAHLDHMGGLLTMFDTWKHHIPWFALPENRPVVEVVLDDACKLSRSEEVGCQFDPRVVQTILEHHVPVEESESIEILPGVKATPYHAGHVHGSCSWLLESADCQIFFSGDYCRRPLISAPRNHWPGADALSGVDVAIFEGTYADSEKPFIDGESARFDLRDTVRSLLRQGPSVLIPVMSLGRAQEVLRCLDGTPWRVALSGMAARVTEATGMMLPSNVTVIDSMPSDRSPQYAERMSYLRNQFQVFVASAGSLQGGPARSLYNFGCERDLAVPVILTGFQFARTPGRHLLETGQASYVRFSAHAGPDEFTETLDLFSRARKYVIHFPGSPQRLLTRHPQLHLPVGQKVLNPLHEP